MTKLWLIDIKAVGVIPGAQTIGDVERVVVSLLRGLGTLEVSLIIGPANMANTTDVSEAPTPKKKPRVPDLVVKAGPNDHEHQFVPPRRNRLSKKGAAKTAKKGPKR